MKTEIVLTGKFKADGEHLTRDLIVEAAEAKGFRVSSKVTWNTSYVVVGDTGHHGNTRKLQQAQAAGVPILPAQKFYDSCL